MKLYAGIDLHSSNCYLGIIDEKLEKVFGKRVNNSLPLVIDCLEPYKKQLQGVVVESTYNWYWLVDGLQEQGYTVHLNAVRNRQISGVEKDQGLVYSVAVLRYTRRP